MASLPVPAKYVPARRNKGKLLVDSNNFLYNLSRKADSRHLSFWHCSKKKANGCRVTATVLMKEEDDENGTSDEILSIRGDHNHDSDLMAEVAKKAVMEEVALASKDLNISPRSVMANITTKLQNSGQGHAINSLKTSISRQVQRARERELDVPAPPKTWHDLKIPDVLTKNASGEQFLIMDEHIEEHRPERIIGFASPEGINIMQTAEQMFADGTFAVCDSTLFYQMFIIICTTQTGINVPTAFFLLPGKEALNYKKPLLCLKNNHGVPDPPVFHCDFENAIIKSVKDVFPSTRILCCDTHFKRAIRKNIQSHHLMAAYNSDARLQQFVRYVWALSLIPEEDIAKVWDKFVEKAVPEEEEDEWANVEPGDLEAFVSYVENTWIGGTNRRTGRKQNPKFRHALWNKNKAIMNDDDLTTNSSEGYNLQIKLSMPRSANIWKVIHCLIKEDSLVALKLRDQAIAPNSDSSPNSARRSKQERRKAELYTLVSRYGEMPIKAWMDLAVNYYNDTN